MVHRRVRLIFVLMYPSNQVFSIQVIPACCRSHPRPTSEHLQLADAEAGAGERTEGGSWSRREEESGEEERARKCLWATLLKCQLLWIKTLTNVPLVLQCNEEQRAEGCCITSTRSVRPTLGSTQALSRPKTNNAEEALSQHHGTSSGQHTSS